MAQPNSARGPFGRPYRERVLVTGAGGQLGHYLIQSLNRAGHEVIGLGRATGSGVDVVADITDRAQMAAAFEQSRATVVIHGAAYTDVDGCEREPKVADTVNRLGSENVATLAADLGMWLVGVGTDFVFPGDGGAPYTEDAPTGPISVYGASKLAGERAILVADPTFAAARTAWVYGGRGKHFPRTVLTVLRRHGRMEVVDDEVGSPTFAGDLAEALIALMAGRPSGILHLTNEGEASRFELARQVAIEVGEDPARIVPTSTSAFLEKHPLLARRPAHSTLANRRAAALGVRLPPWEDAIAWYAPTLAKELSVP